MLHVDPSQHPYVGGRCRASPVVPIQAREIQQRKLAGDWPGNHERAHDTKPSWQSLAGTILCARRAMRRDSLPGRFMYATGLTVL